MSSDGDQLVLDSGLTAVARDLDVARVHTVLRDSYRLEGELHRIATEKDHTWRLVCGEGEFLVKVSPPDEPAEIVRAQVEAVNWIDARGDGIPVQTVRTTHDGEQLVRLRDRDGGGLLRVHAFVAGTLLADRDPVVAERRSVGAMLGRLDRTLAGFRHPGTRRRLVWDLSHFGRLRSLLDEVRDPHRRELAEEVFAGWDERVEPVLPSLRRQVIHGDFSPYNVVVDPAAPRYVTGVLDFGDTMHSAVVFDPAVLLANHLEPAGDRPWHRARDFLAGYVGEAPLTRAELRVVADAALARIALRALLADWRLNRGTDRADYVRAHAQEDWARLECARQYGHDEACALLLQAGTQKESGVPW